MTRTVRHLRRVLPVLAVTVALSVVVASAFAAPASVSATGPNTAEPGDEITVSFSLTNTGENESGYILDISAPSGWTVTGHSDDGGNWKSSEKSWLWPTVNPGESVNPSVTLQIPSDATGDYTVSATGKDSEGVVGTDSTTVTVETSTPTPTDTETTTSTDAETTTPTDTETTTPTDTLKATPTATQTASPTATPTNIPVLDKDGDGVVDPEDCDPDDPGKRSPEDCREDVGGGIPGFSSVIAVVSLGVAVVVIRAFQS